MAAEQLKNIFLSASVPLEERDPKYFDTADIIAIRDAVIALTQAVLPHYRLIWGGHPSITPLINYVMEKFDLNIQAHVTVYQSLFFEKFFPADNNKFENIIFTENLNDRDASIANMRKRMFTENDFVAGVFIGGMEGIEDEFNLLREYHPNALLLPIASTGAATQIVYDTILPEEMKNERLRKDYGFMSLFQELLIERI
jgi:hypothetical protein